MLSDFGEGGQVSRQPSMGGASQRADFGGIGEIRDWSLVAVERQ